MDGLRRKKIARTAEEKIKDFKMTHGGARENAGRPKGRLNTRTLTRQKIQDDITLRMSNLAGDLKPLDILMEMARTALRFGNLELAMEAATLALPYFHARKASVVEKDPNAPSLEDIARDGDPDMADEPRLTQGEAAWP